MPRWDDTGATLGEGLLGAEAAAVSRPASPERPLDSAERGEELAEAGGLSAGRPRPAGGAERAAGAGQPEAGQDLLGHTDDDEWGWRDRLLRAFFVLVGAVGLGLSLWHGVDAALAVECSPNATCTYTEGQAFYNADSVASTWEDGGREGCCRAWWLD